MRGLDRFVDLLGGPEIIGGDDDLVAVLASHGATLRSGASLPSEPIR